MQIACELVLDARATIGESPTWVASERALYWIDVKAPALFRYEPESGAQRRWDVGSDIGAFAPEAGGTALLALRHGLFRLDLGSGAQTELSPPPFDPSLFRFNEGACDSAGRFWVGVMFDPVGRFEGAPRVGGLHVHTRADGLRPAPDAAELHNGMAWTADERGFFVSHSQKQTIYRLDYDAAAGRIGTRRVFATVPEADGLPDGAAIDAEGGYWCALHGGWALRRFHADGRHDLDVRLPVSQPTMCAFAGDGLETLYVTSAAQGLDAAALAREPAAGGLFRLRPPVAGLARSVLAG